MWTYCSCSASSYYFCSRGNILFEILFLRHSDEIVQLWEEGMKEEIESIGEEKWMVLEQVAWDLMYQPNT